MMFDVGQLIVFKIEIYCTHKKKTILVPKLSIGLIVAVRQIESATKNLCVESLVILYNGSLVSFSQYADAPFISHYV